MVDGKRHGTWEVYFPAFAAELGYWCKKEYENGEEVGEEYDKQYDD